MNKIDQSKLGIRPVAYLNGTLPEGGSVQSTPIYTANVGEFLDPSDERAAQTSSYNVGLEEQLAFVVEDVLDEKEADELVNLTEMFGYDAAAPGIQTPPGMRRNKTVHWIADAALMATLFKRIQEHLPVELEGRRLMPKLSQRLNMYRYDTGDEFNFHIDGDWPGFGLSDDGSEMVQWSGAHSMLTMLLYFNGAEDGIEGGETLLFENGQQKASIVPKKGRALFFRHGHSAGSVLHSGAKLLGNTSKYVARINVLYSI